MIMAMRAMAKDRIRSLPLGMPVTRTLYTGTEGGEYKPLYRRLSAVGSDPSSSVEDTMRGWLKEGRMVTESELMSIVRELRKHKNYTTALQSREMRKEKNM